MRKHPLALCEECPFEHEPFVPTQNLKPRSRIAVVGEAPGAFEAERGIPFTGPSGKLLDQVLDHHDIRREDVMVTNICLCRPENNDDPPKAAIAACKPRLDAELAAGGITKILAVGGTAGTNLIETKKTITNLRIGGPKPYKEDESVDVVATWHPAYCLRSPDAFPSFVSDVAKLNGWKDVTWPEPNYRVFTDGNNIREAIRRLHSVQGNFIIDIETGIDKDTTVVHPENYDLLCLGIAYAKGRAVVLGGSGLQEPEVRYELGNLLRSKRLIGHNIKFDLGGLFPVVGLLKAYADTMLMSYATDERPGHHGLKKQAIEKLGAPEYEEEIRKYVPRGGNYADIPPHILYKYNAFDVACTWDLNEYYDARMDDRERRVHNFLIRASNALMHLERAGIHFDTEYNGHLAEEFLKELYELELEINEITDRVLNPRSWQQIQRYLQDNFVGVTSTEADVLEAVLPFVEGRPYEFIKKLLLHRKRAKLYGTYVKGLAKRVHDGKIYTTYSLHGTTSGRLASRNPNLQNISRDKRIKNQFVVKGSDSVFVQIDYKQAEGRVIATLAQDEYLADLFRDPNRDIFTGLCDQIWGVGKHGNEERVRIKSVFYGLAYGRGPVAIAQELEITEKESRELLRNFKALIPATVAWQASIAHKVLSGEDLVTQYGRKRSFWLITDQNKSDVLNEALSFLPQSIASDICLTALIELQPKLEGLATTRLTVHDALYFECKAEDRNEVAAIASKAMVEAGLTFTDYVPFAVDVKFGSRWSEL